MEIDLSALETNTTILVPGSFPGARMRTWWGNRK
jgi:hypothetical protein